ncbi:MAG: hypothetical protein Q8908_10800, partial [Bacteroidota bacterium]|nr:hypothetical protein [Bacteroidota bacterium]
KLWFRIAGTIFGLVGILHLLRVITNIRIVIGECSIPVWFNLLGLFGASFLCICLWRMSFKVKE